VRRDGKKGQHDLVKRRVENDDSLLKNAVQGKGNFTQLKARH